MNLNDHLLAISREAQEAREALANHDKLEAACNDTRNILNKLAQDLIKLQEAHKKDYPIEVMDAIKMIVTRAPNFVCFHNIVQSAGGRTICNDCLKELEQQPNGGYAPKAIQPPTPNIKQLHHNVPYGRIEL